MKIIVFLTNFRYFYQFFENPKKSEKIDFNCQKSVFFGSKTWRGYHKTFYPKNQKPRKPEETRFWRSGVILIHFSTWVHEKHDLHTKILLFLTFFDVFSLKTVGSGTKYAVFFFASSSILWFFDHKIYSPLKFFEFCHFWRFLMIFTTFWLSVNFYQIMTFWFFINCYFFGISFFF